MNTSSYEVVIWDFNGTIVNDVALSAGVMNELMRRYGLEPMNDKHYRDIFGFPVEDFYRVTGLTAFASFAELAYEFTRIYNVKAKEDGLQAFSDIVETIKTLHEKAVCQIILSAAQHDLLTIQIAVMGLTGYFDAVLGISDIYSAGKVEIAQNWLNSRETQPQRLLLIGDSEHDKEIADFLAADCVLISRGHVSKERLLAAGVPVFDDASGLLDLIIGGE